MWEVRLVLVVSLLSCADTYFFESGFTHRYTYWAESSLFGQGNVTTVLKFQITALNETDEGHRLHLLSIDSLVQHVQDGIALDNPLKWDLSKSFLFTVDGQGSVRLIHCHPEDHQELLVIKKAIVSVFSVTVQIEEKKSDWEYSAVDTDHLGELEHAYRVEANSQGVKLERKHFSSEDVHRFHEKTIHYNHQGTLHTAEAKDRILLKDTSPKPKKITPLPGEVPHRITVSGDFPDIETAATVSVKLDGKVPFVPFEKIFHNLTAQTLYTEVKKEKLQLGDVRKNISKSFECIHQYPNKDDLNRSLCINTLRDLLQSLNSEDYEQLVDGVLGVGCQGNDSCVDKHLVVIDIVARIGDETSQRLLLRHVFSKQSPENEKLRRIFIHCAALKHPEASFVRAVQSFCFGQNGEHHGSRSMTHMQSRACLALGSLIRHLHNKGDYSQANMLAELLETWLDKHREEVLSGYVDVNIHDKLWAEIHVGLIGRSWDLLLIEACYRGRLSYNMNIIKDYTVGLYEDITSAFDHVVNRILEPMEKAANGIVLVYHDENANQSKSGFDPLAQVVKQLPVRTENALKGAVGLTRAAEALSGIPIVTKIQQLAVRAQSLVEDVHTEVTDLFGNIVDTAVTALPYAEKEIRKSMNMVLDGLHKVTRAPQQALNFIQRAQMGYHLSLQIILEGNNIIKQATSAHTGSRSSFMNAGHELNDIMETTRLLVNQLKAQHARRKRDANPFGEMSETTHSELDSTLNSLYEKADHMVATITDLVNKAPRDLQAGLDKQAFYTEILKTSFEAFKEGIGMAVSRIHALFGQKFFPGFPNQRRPCDSVCGCGYFSSDCPRYNHPGLDLKLDQGWKIPSPVSGMMFPEGSGSVKIQPKTQGFTDYEIILSNIIVNESYNLDESGVFVNPGDGIGTPIGKNGCEDSHFHIAMRKISDEPDSHLCYYSDPSPFLDRMEPIPKWHQECKDFTFKHIGQVIDFHNLTKGFAVIAKVLEEIAVSVGRQLIVKALQELPEKGVLGPLKNIAVDLVSHVDLNPGNLKNLFSTGLGEAGKHFFRNISSTHFSLEKIVNLANSAVGILPNGQLKESLNRVMGVIHTAQNIIQQPIVKNMTSMAMGALGRVLSSRGVQNRVSARLSTLLQPQNGSRVPTRLTSLLQRQNRSREDVLRVLAGVGQKVVSSVLESTAGNDRSSPNLGQGCLVDNLLTKAVQSGVDSLGSAIGVDLDLVSELSSSFVSSVSGRLGLVTALKASVCQQCPSFGNALAQSAGSTCIPHKDCLGFDCDAEFKWMFHKEKLSIAARVLPLQRKVNVTVSGHNLEATLGQETIWSSGVTVLGVFAIKLRMDSKWEVNQTMISLKLVACTAEKCLPELKLANNVRFSIHTETSHSSQEMLGSIVGNLASLPLSGLTRTVADFSLPLSDIAEQFSGVAGSISDMLHPDMSEECTAETEFKNPHEVKDMGAFPPPGENGEFNVPFFKFDYPFPVGPCVFQIYFGAAGVLGVSFDVQIETVNSFIKTEIKPYVAGNIQASFSLSIVVASAGIDLSGYLLRTGFPLALTTNFTKQPVVSRKSLGVELIPLELKLTARLKILFIIHISKVLWQWRADPIRTTVWEKIARRDDTGPPRFPYCDKIAERCSRTQMPPHAPPPENSPHPCLVTQLSGRHPKDPAFRIDFTTEDDDSDLQVWYAIGDYPGGANIQGWTEIRGSSLVVPAALPCGIPLHFMVRARNTQGLETISQCSLPTYDCTFPDGRVDMASTCSSHPNKLSARIVMYEDSELKEEGAFHAVGYSPGSYGHEIVNWLPLNISRTRPQPGVSGVLSNFDSARPGQLTSRPKLSLRSSTVEDCASECMKVTSCVSFSYEQYLHVCELQEVVEGPSSERRTDNHFQTYERLGKSYARVIHYEHLVLRHGTRYFVNVDVENVLGYRATLRSVGTMVDFTSPVPAYPGEGARENLMASGCAVSILQRCEDQVPASLNHRRIIDGKGSVAVFNGNRKGEEVVATVNNFQAAANWNEFKDEECGIHGYTWAVGTALCADDIVSFRDPHALIADPSDWTNMGLATGLSLVDGVQYFVTVQAVNDIIFGGDLVTTVCHSTPFVVDTTPPILDSITDVLFDDDFHFLVIYFNASDPASGIARVEFGLGATKYDVMVRKYIPYEVQGVAGNTYITVKDFEANLGTPTWIRLKVVNKVDLTTAGYGESPILIDNTPPVAGRVLDGENIGVDIDFQPNDTQICAQWTDFYDPESNINSYEWGVGYFPGTDDVVKFHLLSSYTKQSCHLVQLLHNVTYFSTIIAYNKALNQKSINVSSNGVLIDVTPPVKGTVADGPDADNDQDFTSETAVISASWANFSDPESRLGPYSLHVYVNNVLQRTFTNILVDTFHDSSFTFHNGDTIHVELEASNRAGSKVVVPSDGMLVDHSAPKLLELHTANYSLFQQNDDSLHFIWQFEDPESGIAQYCYTVFQLYGGRKSKFWPKLDECHVFILNATSTTKQDLHLEQVNLTNGAQYNLQVTAINRAQMGAVEESNSIGVDVTAPMILEVRLAPLGEDEEVNGNNEVELVDGKPVSITWLAQDGESGISQTRVCIGLKGLEDCFISAPSNMKIMAGPSVASTYFTGLELEVSSDDHKVLYQAYVVTVNGAGAMSSISTSKPFLIVRANVPGVVFDGWKGTDEDFSYDKSSIAITFSGFSSEACGIVGYEWAIGTQPFYTDIMPYTDFGLVVWDDGFGYADMEMMQFEGQKYFSTVRARTGHGCHERYIVASSDGFTLDTTPPSVKFQMGAQQVGSYDVVYQTTKDRLEVEWEVTDSGSVNGTRLLVNTFGTDTNMLTLSATSEHVVTIHPFPSSGNTISATILASDKAGNEISAQLPFITFDFDAPNIEDLQCTKIVSVMSPLVTCTWLTVREEQSPLDKIEVGIGSGPSFADLLNMTSVPVPSKQWSFFAGDIVSSKISHFYVLVRASNRAGLQSTVPVEVRVDSTPPTMDSVSIVTSPLPGYHAAEKICQTSQDYLEVLLSGIDDNESGIKSVEIALGSSSGSSDLRSFREYPLVNGLYLLDHLSLTQGAIVYVTVRVTNTAGLQTIGQSRSVVISPEPRLRVWDGPGEEDVDGQAELHLIQGHWRYSDPCPIISTEWSVQELTGKIITNYTAVVGNSNRLYNDLVTLENFKTYVNYVRITDAINRTFTGFSDGVTVIVQRPEVAVIRDGLTQDDQDFQEGTDCLFANWDDFGTPRSSLPSDQIVRYEAGVGTDRRYLFMRTDVHAFQDAGLVNSISFCGLNLTAKSVTYYITVRAHSAAGSFAESSSDGIRVGYSSDIKAGKVQVNRFQSNVNNIRIWWTDFVSDMVIIQYYVGVSTTPYPWVYKSRNCYEILDDKGFVFDVYPLHSVNTTSLAVLEGLSLAHGKIYFVTLVAANQMGQCCASGSEGLVVDTTPPAVGFISVQGLNAEKVMYVHSQQTLEVDLNNNSDPESGLKNAHIQLFASTSCDPAQDFDLNSMMYSVTVQNETHVAMHGFELKNSLFYFVRLTLTNGADLETRTVSKPMMLDFSPPDRGIVKVGRDWQGEEQTVLNRTDEIRGMLALKSVLSTTKCDTQADLFSLEAKLDWKTMGSNFMEDCAGFGSSGLELIVQHNPSLTGMNRGGIQFFGLGVREGNYKFVMSAGEGEKILTGISLASPLLNPPFFVQNGILPGNQSSLPCDPAVSSCLVSNSNTSAEKMLQKTIGYGIGISFFSQKDSMKALFWVQDKTNLQQTWVSLGFSPTATQAEYMFTFKRRQDGSSYSWDVALSINGQSKRGFSGLQFSDDLVLSAYMWNIDDFSPSVLDPFHAFRTVATISSVTVPFKERPLCSFGSPFHDHASGIKEIWFGVSDDLNKTANVAPYRLVKSYCQPCLLGCERICSPCAGEWVLGDYTILSESVSGLQLHAANEALLANGSSSVMSENTPGTTAELGHFQLPTYFLDVKVVDHGGLYTEAKSVGMIVDTSPPVITSVHCFDPLYSRDEAVIFLGNNHTVGVTWDASDDVSSITEVWVSLGTQPKLDDVVPKAQKNTSMSQHIFDNLQNVLHEGRQYFATVGVVSNARLTTQEWSNFTVSTAPPDVKALSLSMPYATVHTISDEPVAVISSTQHLELNLQMGPNVPENMEPEYYEWAIGTVVGEDDIFPRTVVGTKGTRKVAIVNGFMQLDAALGKISIGDYTKKNLSSDTQPDPGANLFNMEPGRCLAQSLYGVSKAHVLSRLDLMPTCVKRNGDLLLTADNSSSTFILSGNTFVPGNAQASNSSLQLKIKVSSGGLLVGSLSQQDLSVRYGSSASTQFSPFIVYPHPLTDLTSRWLSRRLVRMPGPYIFLSPLASTTLASDLSIAYAFPVDTLSSPNNTAVLLMWNAEQNQWMAPEEFCPGREQSFDYNTHTVGTKVCIEAFVPSGQEGNKVLATQPNTSYSRRRRSSAGTATGNNLAARMLTLAELNPAVANKPPVIKSTSFSVDEDGESTLMLSYTDPDHDQVKFTLAKQPEDGRARVTEDGSLWYRPAPNFSGTDIISIVGEEIISPQDQARGIVPHIVHFDITVTVVGKNDPPDISYYPGQNDSEVTQVLEEGIAAGNGLNISVFLSSNTTTSVHLGTILYGDVDTRDAVQFLNKTGIQPGASFETADVRDLNLTIANLMEGFSAKDLVLQLEKGFSGQISYSARVRDAANSFSKQLTVNVYVLFNPCIHGHCESRTSGSTCQELQRLHTFDPYKCECDLGYEGQWCGVETNECDTATCSVISDCFDLVGEFQCVLSPVKMVAIFLGCIVAVALGSFAILKLKKRRPSKVHSARSPLIPRPQSINHSLPLKEVPYAFTNYAMRGDHPTVQHENGHHFHAGSNNRHPAQVHYILPNQYHETPV